MPQYCYICNACKHEWEEEQRIKDPPLTKCPECETEGKVERLIARTSFVLNGNRWSKDGYSG